MCPPGLGPPPFRCQQGPGKPPGAPRNHQLGRLRRRHLADPPSAPHRPTTPTVNNLLAASGPRYTTKRHGSRCRCTRCARVRPGKRARADRRDVQSPRSFSCAPPSATAGCGRCGGGVAAPLFAPSPFLLTPRSASVRDGIPVDTGRIEGVVAQRHAWYRRRYGARTGDAAGTYSGLVPESVQSLAGRSISWVGHCRTVAVAAWAAFHGTDAGAVDGCADCCSWWLGGRSMSTHWSAQRSADGGCPRFGRCNGRAAITRPA